ncbi:MAG: hopanoid-associated sugar epimerase [Desulfobacterales bacterium]
MNLVTGASGFIGGRIVHALIKRGENVRVFVRPDSNLVGLSGLTYERVDGDVTDPQSLARSAAGCRCIYHSAALYRLWTRNTAELYRVNIDGTRNVIAAGTAAGVDRIVYTSSVATIGIPANGVGDEDTPVSLGEMIGDYKRSKFLAEQVVFEEVRRGAPVVIVNPTFPVGVGDVKPTPSGKLITDFLKRKMPAFMDTGLNVVDVDDVACGHVLAAERGRIGQRYILGNCNMTLKEILLTLAEITNFTVPRVKLPYYPILMLAYMDAALCRLVPGRQPRIPPDGVKMARKKMFVDPSKALHELKIPQTPPAVALNKAVEWFRSQGYV